jgi:hypothetical protein
MNCWSWTRCMNVSYVVGHRQISLLGVRHKATGRATCWSCVWALNREHSERWLNKPSASGCMQAHMCLGIACCIAQTYPLSIFSYFSNYRKLHLVYIQLLWTTWDLRHWWWQRLGLCSGLWYCVPSFQNNILSASQSQRFFWDVLTIWQA